MSSIAGHADSPPPSSPDDYQTKCISAIKLAKTIKKTNQQTQVLLPLFKLLAHCNPTAAKNTLQETPLDQPLRRRYRHEIRKIEIKKGPVDIPKEVKGTQLVELISKEAKRDSLSALKKAVGIMSNSKIMALISVASIIVQTDQHRAKRILKKAEDTFRRRKRQFSRTEIIEYLVQFGKVEKLLAPGSPSKSFQEAKKLIDSFEGAIFWENFYVHVLEMARIECDSKALDALEAAAKKRTLGKCFEVLLACADVRMTRCEAPSNVALRKALVLASVLRLPRVHSRVLTVFRENALFKLLEIQVRIDLSAAKKTISQLKAVANTRKNPLIRAETLCNIAKFEVEIDHRDTKKTLREIKKTDLEGRDNLRAKLFEIEAMIDPTEAQKTFTLIQNSHVKDRALFARFEHTTQRAKRVDEEIAGQIQDPFWRCKAWVTELRHLKKVEKISGSNSASLGSTFDDTSANDRTGSYSEGITLYRSE